MTNITLRPTKKTEKETNPYVIRTLMGELAPALTLVQVKTTLPPTQPMPEQWSVLATKKEWSDPEFRQGYLEASIEEGLAWQIRANRELRGLTQAKLAEAIGSTQPGVARFEDPEYGKHSLETLVKFAHAFDCALAVRFIPYSQLALESEDLSPEALYATPYQVETKLAGCL